MLGHAHKLGLWGNFGTFRRTSKSLCYKKLRQQKKSNLQVYATQDWV
jgi:hypothetical protein